MIPATSSSKPLVSSKEHKTKLAPLAEVTTSSVRPSMRLCNKGRTSSLVNSNLSTCVMVLHTKLGLTPDDSNNSGRKKKSLKYIYYSDKNTICDQWLWTILLNILHVDVWGHTQTLWTVFWIFWPPSLFVLPAIILKLSIISQILSKSTKIREK